MVRSVRSRAVAIFAGCSATRSVGWSAAARRSATPASRRASISARSAIRTLASRSSGALPLLTIPLCPHNDTPSADHRTVNACDHTRSVCLRDFHQGVALAQIDLSDPISWNSAFTCDHAHEIADLHAVARTHGHEEARHSPGRPARALSVRRPRPSGRGLISLRHATLRSFALQKLQSSGRELSSV
jgi:hypothetical protein